MATAAVSPAHVVVKDHPTTGLWSWLTTVDHKRIGMLYLFTALTWFAIGGLEAVIMRAQLMGPNGKLVVIGVTFDPIAVTPVQLITGMKPDTGNRTIQGWAAGIPTDSEDTLRFCELSGVRPMIETFPLERAAEGYARMMSGKAQFRVVLTM